LAEPELLLVLLLQAAARTITATTAMKTETVLLCIRYVSSLFGVAISDDWERSGSSPQTCPDRSLWPAKQAG
jgi:hypothetical protein